MEENKLTSSQIILRFAVVFFIIMWASIFISACAPTQRIDYNFVKVLGVTVEGDTILIDVNSLRPRVYNNYYYDNGINRYPYNYNYYNTPPVIIRPVNPKPRPTKPVVTPPSFTAPKPITKPTKDKQ
mgnify:CR=1 FL=1